MARVEDGDLWYSVAEWEARERIRERKRRAIETAADPPEIDVRTEARQWRAGRRQGALARTSPLRAERTRQQSPQAEEQKPWK